MLENACDLYRETGRIDPELVSTMNEADLLTLKTLVDTDITRIKAQIDEAKGKAAETGIYSDGAWFRKATSASGSRGSSANAYRPSSASAARTASAARNARPTTARRTTGAPSGCCCGQSTRRCPRSGAERYSTDSIYSRWKITRKQRPNEHCACSKYRRLNVAIFRMGGRYLPKRPRFNKVITYD